MQTSNFGVVITLGVHHFYFLGDTFPLKFFWVSPTSCIDPTRSGVGSPHVDTPGSNPELSYPLPILKIPV